MLMKDHFLHKGLSRAFETSKTLVRRNSPSNCNSLHICRKFKIAKIRAIYVTCKNIRSNGVVTIIIAIITDV